MKLSKLYSNMPFHNINFITDKGGLNVVIGDAKKKQGNSHCLGKSKLVELLDFMLLKQHSSTFFFKKDTTKEIFSGKGYKFYLEIFLNNGQYLTIRRTIDTPTKIDFKFLDAKSKSFILYEDEQFDERLPFKKSKVYLNEVLDFDFCKETDENYRRTVSYSLRHQGDYEPSQNTIFKLTKFAKSNQDIQWKPLLFSLLGFNGGTLKEKYDLEKSIKEITKTIKAQEKDFGIKTEEKDLLVGKIQSAEIDREKLSTELKNLDFYKEDRALIRNLVGNVESEISAVNIKLYQLEHDIKKLEDSIRNNFSFDLERVKDLFGEVELHFPQQLSKSYEQLLDFNHKITKERNEQIRETLLDKKEEERALSLRLSELNKSKEGFRSIIQDTTLFKKYSTYQKKLVEIEKDLAKLQTQLEGIDKMEKRKEFIEETQKNRLQEVKDELKQILDTTAEQELYMNIRRTFSSIVKRILNETAIITITPNSTYNVDFKPNFPNSAKDEGNTYYKILCVAFDLAVLINYRNKSHFRFVYHDDVISGDDNGIKSRLIETVREICSTHDIQYIFSIIKDNIPPSQNLSDNMILELHDRDEDGKLFKMEF